VAVRVIGSTRLQLAIPPGTTTGPIAIFTPTRGAFSPQSFTVTRSTATPAQPQIASFSPASGAAGTVVTLNGSGFTGVHQAWVGKSHGAGIRVISDSQAQVTIPAGATTGAIGIFNPVYNAFTSKSFTVR